MSDGESSHHSSSSLEGSAALPFEVKVEAVDVQPVSEVTDLLCYSVTDCKVWFLFLLRFWIKYC